VNTDESAGPLFDRVGGMAFFDGLVSRFYDGVFDDPVLRPMYPDDRVSAERHLALFLAQYFGGPRTYEQERGAPMLRMRHLPFAIDVRAKERWLVHMDVALRSAGLEQSDESVLRDYFVDTAAFMVNRGGFSLIG
jgi:hemoglobin